MIADARCEAAIDALERGDRILVTRLSYLGDVIMSLALVHRLKERFPNAEIDYLTRTDCAEVLKGEPLLSAIHRLPQSGGAAHLRLIRDMRRRSYAVAIDLFSNPRSALLVRLSGARVRIGGDRRGRRRMYTHPVRVPGEVRSATAFHLYHARPLGIDGAPALPSLNISIEERNDAAAVLESAGLDLKTPVVALHPGGKWQVKRWPSEYFGALAARMSSTYGMQAVVLCGPGEEKFRDTVLREAAASGANVKPLPTLALRGTAAVLQAVDGLVCNDGGIMHMSVAVGTPTVGVFGSAEPEIWFPYEGAGPFAPAWVPITCRPCHGHTCSHISCLRRVGVERVERALLNVMREGSEEKGAL